jgi:hypothetical protein
MALVLVLQALSFLLLLKSAWTSSKADILLDFKGCQKKVSLQKFNYIEILKLSKLNLKTFPESLVNTNS